MNTYIYTLTSDPMMRSFFNLEIKILIYTFFVQNTVELGFNVPGALFTRILRKFLEFRYRIIVNKVSG